MTGQERDVEALAESPGAAPTDADRDLARRILDSDWLAERDAAIRDEAKAEALREAADQWTQGQWSDVMLPKPVPPAVPVIDYSNRVGEWLRECAALLDGGDQ